MATDSAPQTFDIPKTCIGAVVKNEGPDFYVEIEQVPVPEIGMATLDPRRSLLYWTDHGTQVPTMS